MFIGNFEWVDLESQQLRKTIHGAKLEFPGSGEGLNQKPSLREEIDVFWNHKFAKVAAPNNQHTKLLNGARTEV